jgi:chemotaxis methyl-accepting protein methylase/mannose-6-phosphate isomerase-like protein (cupin superfamily)
MRYTHFMPAIPSFDDKGLVGYTFGPLQQKDLEVYYIEVEKGHDTFMVSKRITRTYYVLSGSGFFTIGGVRYDVGSGMLVEVPPMVEYSYSGKMKLIGISKPRWFNGNDTHTKWNPDVVHGEDLQAELPNTTQVELWKILAKRLIGFYLRLNGRAWKKLPSSFSTLWPVRLYGDSLHTLARRFGARAQAPSTFFLRNRPQLELIRRLVERRAESEPLKVAVLGCSTGVEAYSIAWSIRSARPDLKLALHAVDISKRAVEFGQCGRYSLADPQLTDTDVLERMTETEMTDFFDRNGDEVEVKSWIKEGIKWQVGDVVKPETIDALGLQDIVIASNFLCHMYPLMAEKSLRNIANLVRPGGYIFVSGVDLSVRTKVAAELGWRPVQELLEEIHEGDPSMRTFWPWHYGGLEPLNKKRRDWKLRYAAAFQARPCEKASDWVNFDIHRGSLGRPSPLPFCEGAPLHGGSA